MLPRSEKTILDFFKVKIGNKDSNNGKEKEEEKENDEKAKYSRLSSPIAKTNRTKKKKITIQRKKPLFKLPKPSDDPEKTLKQKMSLAYGLLSKGIEFDDDLCFSNPLCPPSANDASLEANLQVFQKIPIT